MKENIFSTPIYHDKIDLNKIIINTPLPIELVNKISEISV